MTALPRQRVLAALMACAHVFHIASVLAAPPKVDNLFPAGGQRGTEVEVTAAGTFAQWPPSCWTDREGIEIEPAADKGKFKIRIGDDAPAGAYWIRVHDAEGAASPKPFFVDSLPEVLEKEPNNQVPEAQTLDQSAIVNGRLQSGGDVDAFAVTLAKGQTLVASLQANHHLDSPMDGVLQVCNAEGFVLEQNDDARGVDPLVVFTAPADGRYLVRIFAFPTTPNSSIAFAGANTFIYRLTLTTGGFADHAAPLAVSQDKATSVELFGWNIPATAAPAEVSVGNGQPVSLFHADVASSVLLPPTPFTSLPAADVTTREQAQEIQLPVVLTGRIGSPREEDVFRFSATKGQKLSFRVESDSLGFVLDPQMLIIASDGKVLAEVDDSNRQRDCEITQAIPADGEYLVVVRDIHGHGGFRYVYRLTAAEATPDFTLKLAADSFVLTPGKPLEVVVNVDRRNGFSDPIVVTAAGLPEGVKATPVTSEPKGDSAKSVKLVLASDAGPLSTTFQVVGKSTREHTTEVTGRFSMGSWADHTDAWLTVLKPAQ